MSQQELIYRSVKAIHVLGFLLWVGSMFALAMVLAAHQRAASGARDALVAAEKSIGRAMELGALLAILCGVVMIFTSAAPVSPLRQPYLHIKLTLVVVLIVMHGMVRAKMARLGAAKDRLPPAG